MNERQDEERLIQQTLSAVKAVEEFQARGSSANGNVVRLEGAGSIWNGLAIGVALGATIVACCWISFTMQRYEIRSQQAEAYQKAVYMLVPRFAEQIDEELKKQKEREQP